MNIDMHGKAIAEIYFNGGIGNQSGNPEAIVARGNKTLHLSATYHGDHDEFWVVECIDGKETARHNCKTVDTIMWALQETGATHG